MPLSFSSVEWVTRILKHWHDCNTKINIGEGETHTSVSRFWTSIASFSCRHTLNWVPVVGGLFFEALVGHPETNATVIRELKQRRFWTTHVNRKWTFCIHSQLFYPYFQAIHLYKKKILSNTNMVASRYIESERPHFRLTSVAQKLLCFSSLVKKLCHAI